MLNIALHGASFFAYHGFYPEEQKLGNHFIVDIDVCFEPGGSLNSDDIGNTVNYEQLHAIAAGQMKHTRKLIETVVQGILDDINNCYSDLESATVSIKKLNPPFGCKVDYSAVTINYNRKK